MYSLSRINLEDTLPYYMLSWVLLEFQERKAEDWLGLINHCRTRLTGKETAPWVGGTKQL